MQSNSVPFLVIIAALAGLLLLLASGMSVVLP